MTNQVCPRCQGSGEVPLPASFAGGKSKMCGKCQGTGKDLSKPTAPPAPPTSDERKLPESWTAGFNGC